MSIPLLSFTPGRGDVVVDFDALLEFGLFVEGVSRSGKTNLVRVLLEQTYGQASHIILDPEGEFGTLRTAARPYLIVGRGGDVDMAPDDDVVRALVREIVGRRINAIFDLFGYEDDEQHVIVSAVCDELARLPESNPHDIILHLSEMQDFAPEQGSGKATSLAAVRRVAKRGKKRGVTLTGDSQRLSDVSKAATTQMKNKAIGGTDHVDAKRALSELGLPASELRTVMDLPQGQFYVKGPAISRHAQLVQVPKAETSPEKRRRGERPPARPPAPAEIAAIAAALAKIAPAADATAPTSVDTARADERVELQQRRIAELEADLERAREIIAERNEAWSIALQPIADEAEGVARMLRALSGDAPAATTDSVDLARQHDDALDDDSDADRRAFEAAQTLAGIAEARRRVTVRPDPAARRETADDCDALRDGEQRILDALAELRTFGHEQPERLQVATWTGYDLSGGAGGRYVGRLVKDGLVEIPSAGHLALTAAGRAQAAPVTRAPTRAELHRRVFAKLSDGERRILEFLISQYPDASKRTVVGATLGYDLSGGAGGRYVGRLMKLGVVDIPRVGELRAAHVLFPKGVR